MEAAGEDDVERLRALVRSGARATLGDYDKRTALHHAAARGHAAAVAFLLDEADADPNAADRW